MPGLVGRVPPRPGKSVIGAATSGRSARPPKASAAVPCAQDARPQDIVGRFGGEEFIVFLPGAELEETYAFAERVRTAVGEERVSVADGAEFSVTISAGVACIPGCAADLEEAIRRADDRLLAAKRHGRNRVVANDELARPAA